MGNGKKKPSGKQMEMDLGKMLQVMRNLQIDSGKITKFQEKQREINFSVKEII